MDFVELRAHTAFSFGDGAVTPEALAARAAELDYPAIGLTDTADFGGIPRFVLEAQVGAALPFVRYAMGSSLGGDLFRTDAVVPALAVGGRWSP